MFNINKKAGVVISILSALLIMPSLAYGESQHAGWMLGGGAYVSHLNDDIEVDWEDPEDISFDSSTVAFNITGGYRFNKWLSIDAAYWDLGDYKSDRNDDGIREEFDTDTLTLGGMVSVPIWIIDLYARGGAAFWQAEGENVDIDGTDPYYGLGLAFNIGSSLDLYAEWIRFDLESNIDTLGLGVRWTF